MINLKPTVLKAQSARPLMWIDRLLGGDPEQHRVWRRRLEEISRTEALMATRDRRKRALIANRRRWRRARRFGRLGQLATVLPIGGLTGYLIYLYAVGHGFGLWPVLLFGAPFLLLPAIARDRFERAALGAMAAARGSSRSSRGARSALSGVFRSFTAGFAAGGSVVFLMALMSWFMTPAPTLWAEFVIDFMDASFVGLLTGLVSAPLGLLMGIDPPSQGELDGPVYPALLEGAD